IVEGTRYKLHRYLFNRAQNFPARVWSGSEPYYMTESKIDFERFLSVLYPLCVLAFECETPEEWSSVLLLADRWRMMDIRRLAINELALCAGPVDKIALGHRYNVEEWLGPAYLALAMRKMPITSAEGMKIGVQALIRIS
ncbi:hypothetical protein DFH09DRAFT_1461052, partial [Mycena vulgaris]